jgi:hypothetical protein
MSKTAVDWTTLTAEQVALIVENAEMLVEAHKRRNPTSQRATLGEVDAIFNLRLAFRQIEDSA